MENSRGRGVSGAIVLCGVMGWAVAGSLVHQSAAAEDSAVAKAAAQLNGTQWAIELTPMYGKKPKRPLKDTVAFEQGTVTSEELSSDGYPTSNYTLTVGDDGISVWETMQTSERNGVVFWRGEVHGETMRGILSKHPLKGDAEDYTFVGHQAGATDQTAEPLVEAAAPRERATAQAEQAAQAEAASTETGTPKKTRKGWFW